MNCNFFYAFFKFSEKIKEDGTGDVQGINGGAIFSRTANINFQGYILGSQPFWYLRFQNVFALSLLKI